MKSLIPWRNSEGALESFRREMDDMFSRFFGPIEEKRPTELDTWAPRVDIEETDKELLVKADLPGVDPKEVEINVTDGSIEIRGEKKEEKEEKKKDYLRTERFVGKFYRQFPLPAGTDPNKISAESSNGVVTIHIPKSAEAQPKKIAVKTNS